MYFITFLNPSLLEDDILQKATTTTTATTTTAAAPNLRSDPRKGYCEESNLVGEVRRRRERSNGGSGISRTTRKKVFLRRIFYLSPPAIASFLTDFLSIIPLLTPLQAALLPGSLPVGRYAFIFAIFEIFCNASYQPSTLCYHVHRRPVGIFHCKFTTVALCTLQNKELRYSHEHVNVIHMYMNFIMRQLSRRGSGAFERANASLFAFSSRIIYRTNTHVCVRVFVCEHECVFASTRGRIAMSVHSLYARLAVAQRSEVSSVVYKLRAQG
uniref:G-protein coupled receptors family 1 profile domain-containing protein n=1 Tax=Trichogramma kaykai TaxID=54128 RepID=A0ABD2X7A0_9HYME